MMKFLIVTVLTVLIVVLQNACRSYNGERDQFTSLAPNETYQMLAHQNKKANRSTCGQTKLCTPIKNGGESFKIFASTNSSRELPEISASMNVDDKQFIQASEIFFSDHVEKFESYSIGEAIKMVLATTVHSSAYNPIFTHRYDNFNDMKRASGPQLNKGLCLKQLENMRERDRRQELEGFRSTDTSFYQIMLAWGKVAPDFTSGNLFFVGSYEGCLRSKLVQADKKHVDMHYCVMSLKSNDWTQIDRHDLLDIKVGICIPKTCDSFQHKNKYELISAMALRQLRPMNVNGLKMSGLYCLPSDDSPLRSIRHSPNARLAATCFILWVALLVYATYRYSKIEQYLKQIDASREPQKDALASAQIGCSESRIKIFRMLSITNNFKLLFNTTKESALLESSSSPASTNKPGVTDQTTQLPSNDKIVDLRCIEGIKVIAMCYVIMGHVVMCMPTIMSNGRDLADQGTGALAFLLANLVPAFAVNSFFVITGLLTCYLMFKQNRTQPLITSPAKWIALILYRYVRIMPMYALVVLYCKTLAKFSGSGPLWDYGTSAHSQRRICEQEPWAWMLTFTSNLRSPMEHCIPGGWYLSNDFQFLLVTPIFLLALNCNPQFGKALLYLSIVAGHAAGFMSIYWSQVSDLRPIAMFLPFGFKTYVSHLSFNYTHPQYRIPAYLIGLLIGHKLYELEEEKRRYDALPEAEKSHQAAPSWTRNFKNRGGYLSSMLIFVCCISPIIGRMIPFTKDTARWAVSFVTPSYHVMFATAIGMFIMLATTGHGNKHLSKFLSSPSWKPLARLSLCCVLVNVEVINYIIQSNPRREHVSNGYLITLNTVCIIGTYLVATMACVLFEAPIRAGLNASLAKLTKKMARKQKQKIC